MATLIELLATLDELHCDGGVKATSVRMPEALHHPVALATELGMAESFTAAMNDALALRVRAFARQQALAAHLAQFPHDHPDLEAIVRRRASGTDHPAALHEQVTVAAARRYERRHPDWAVSGEGRSRRRPGPRTGRDAGRDAGAGSHGLMTAPVRHLGLDNEAVSALLATTPQHGKRAQVLEAIMAANGHAIVPTAVRCEAQWDRTEQTTRPPTCT